MSRSRVEPGQCYGRLEVVQRIPPERPGLPTRWVCRCVCGQSTTVVGYSLVKGITKSCGCLKRAGRTPRHGASRRAGRTSEYMSWRGIRTRCLNPHADGYALYGGRGITVCERWLRSFEAFLEDMGPRPSLQHSIDRIDPDGPYAPSNCRWATKAQQDRNKRSNRFVLYEGQRLCLTDVAQRAGINVATLRSRLNVGCSVEDALTRPVQVHRVSVDGRQMSLRQACTLRGLNVQTVKARIRRGWSLDDALSRPVVVPHTAAGIATGEQV